MKLDELNNSQMMLLCILVTLMVSMATSVGTLAIMLKRTDPAEQTVVRQTVNRIIERTVAPINYTTGNTTTDTLSAKTIRTSRVEVYTGEVFVGYGYVISSKGDILWPHKSELATSYSVVIAGKKTELTIKNVRNVDFTIFSTPTPVLKNYLSVIESPAEVDVGVWVTAYTASQANELYIDGSVSTINKTAKTFSVAFPRQSGIHGLLFADSKIAGVITGAPVDNKTEITIITTQETK